MITEELLISDLESKKDDSIHKKEVMSGEVKGVLFEFFAINRGGKIREDDPSNNYDVLLVLAGKLTIEVADETFQAGSDHIARLPFNKPYLLYPSDMSNVQFLRIRNIMNDPDLSVISQNRGNHTGIYIKALDACPVYTEDIKSSKSINRMILHEGLVPRFCMGSVETEGPDAVAEHSHPMLDQLFLGLQNCKCTCIANGEHAELTENMMLHIPLGSTHSVTVAKGDKLAYLWFDFFLTQEGQAYMKKQHQIRGE